MYFIGVIEFSLMFGGIKLDGYDVWGKNWGELFVNSTVDGRNPKQPPGM